jgi:hypothetical protein
MLPTPVSSIIPHVLSAAEIGYPKKITSTLFDWEILFCKQKEYIWHLP